MANPLLDAIGTVGNVLDMPGSYLRGALAGRPGERASGREMLEGWGALGANTPGLDWGDVAGFGAEAIADPLALAGPVLGAIKGINRLSRGARALGAADAGPLGRALSFLGREEGAARNPLVGGGNPLGNLGLLAEPGGVKVVDPVKRPSFKWDVGTNMAVYKPVSSEVVPNTVLYPGAWGSNPAMRELKAKGPAGWSSSPSSLHTPIHEIGHHLHHQNVGFDRFGDLGLSREFPFPDDRAALLKFLDEVEKNVSTYARSNPREFVSEVFARQMLGEPGLADLPGSLVDFYRQVGGPESPSKLTEMLKRIRGEGLDLSLLGPLLGAGALGGAAGAAAYGRGNETTA